MSIAFEYIKKSILTHFQKKMLFWLSLFLISFPLKAGLDWQDRPEDVSHEIHRRFEALEEKSESSWGLYNGQYTYNHLGIDQLRLAKKIIEDAAAEGRKEVIILDSGAGNFQSCDKLAAFINEYVLPTDMTIRIIGTRGERYSGRLVEDVGMCKVYKFGSFKIEEHQKELEKRGLNLDGKIDLTISNWAHRHLVDPLGTWLQLYHTTRPKTGLMIMDWFYYLYEGEQFDTRIDAFNHSHNHLMDLLMRINSPFLLKACEDFSGKEVDHFVLKRESDQPLELPLAYSRILECDGPFFDIGSHAVVEFKILDEEFTNHRFTISHGETRVLSGDVTLFHWFKNNRLVTESLFPHFQQLFQIQPGEATPIPLYTSEEIVKSTEELREKLNRRVVIHEEIEKKRKRFMASLKSSLPREIRPVTECIVNEAGPNEHALYQALREGNHVKAQTLIDQGAHLGRDFYFYSEQRPEKLIDLAIKGGLPEGSIAFLLQNRADLSHTSLDGVMDRYRSYEDIKLLIDHGINIKDVNFCLYRALVREHMGLVRLFISLGANVNAFCNCYPMINAAFNNDKLWNYLIDQGAKGALGQDLDRRPE